MLLLLCVVYLNTKLDDTWPNRREIEVSMQRGCGSALINICNITEDVLNNSSELKTTVGRGSIFTVTG
jgi:hypothetical protein